MSRAEEAELTAGEPIVDDDMIFEDGLATVDRMARNDPDSYSWVSNEGWFSDGKWIARLWSKVKRVMGAGRKNPN